MDQLISQITERTGITADQAREAVQVVTTYLKDKLPAPIAAQVDGLLSGQPLGDAAQQALGGLGGLFGKSKVAAASARRGIICAT